MKRIWLWIKNNKLATGLFAAMFFLLVNSYLNKLATPVLPRAGIGTNLEKVGSSSLSLNSLTREETAPSTSEKRLVIETSNLSLVVKNVQEVSQQIIKKSKELGGFMVENSLTKPEESPFGTIIVRVPDEKTDEALDYFRSLALKISSEKILGQDVTDQYEDIGERLATLEKTKVKFEEILVKAEKINDILQVQKELISLQRQIDNLKGRQEYLEKSAALTKITVYLSSDELALPYQPEGVFRPQVIFKQAVRSFLKTLRVLAGLLIWLGVYLPVWGGILLIIFIVKWLKKKRSSV